MFYLVMEGMTLIINLLWILLGGLLVAGGLLVGFLGVAEVRRRKGAGGK